MTAPAAGAVAAASATGCELPEPFAASDLDPGLYLAARLR
jgi:hypothetical protein